jgi:hypothetical protein
MPSNKWSDGVKMYGGIGSAKGGSFNPGSPPKACVIFFSSFFYHFFSDKISK